MLIKTSRRTFLHRLGLGSGALLLLPIARELLREANADESFEGKAIFFSTSNGIPDHARPSPGATPETFALNGFDPLEPYRSELLFITPMFIPFNHSLHGAMYPLVCQPGLGGTPNNADIGVNPGGKSIDRYLAAELGQDTPFDSLVLAAGGDGEHYLSADGPNQRLPAIADPAVAFDTIFGQTAGLDPAKLAERFDQDRSVLDYVLDDVGRMQQRLGASEVAKMDQYLDSIRGMERKIDNLQDTVTQCSDVAAPDLNELGAMVELATQAVICGLTRFVYIRARLTYDGPELIPEPDEDWRIPSHRFWHEGQRYPEAHQEFIRNQVRHMATIRERLGAIDIGGNNLADDTLLVWLNEGGGSHHNGSYDIPLMLLGSARGYFDTGRYVELPSIQRDTEYHAFLGPYEYDDAYEPRIPNGSNDLPKHPISDAMVSIANAMGLPIDRFGHPDFCLGPLPGLTA